MSGYESTLQVQLLPEDRTSMSHVCPHLPQKPAEFEATLSELKGCAVPKCRSGIQDVWVCLTCMYAGCGRSGEKHAMAHYQMHRHPCVINKGTTMIWCYDCDAELVEKDEFPSGYVEALTAFREAVAADKKPKQGTAFSSTPTPATASPSLKGQSVKMAPPQAKKGEDSRAPLLLTYPATAGLTGLQNLGNTCFLNACLQALSNIPQLSTYFTECNFVSQQAKPDSLAYSYRNLMIDMWYRAHVGVRGVDPDSLPWVAPTQLFRCLRVANPIFEGFNQQDSHEALRTILNELHEKLAVDVPIGLYRTDSAPASSGPSASGTGLQSPLLESGAGRSGKQISRNGVDSDDSDADTLPSAAKRARTAKSVDGEPAPSEGLRGPKWLVDGPYTGPETVQRSIISDLFQGVYCSRVRCRSCGTDSLTYDTFYDLSVPIPRSHHDVARGSDGTSHTARATSWAAQTADGAADSDGYPEGFDASLMSPATIAVVPNVMRSALAADSTTATVTAPAVAEPVVPLATEQASEGWFWPMVSKLFCSARSAGMGFGFGEAIGLGDCLYNFFDWEELTGSDQYYCEVCKCKRDATKRISIVSLPEILCIQLKRFSFQGWGGSKNTTTVAFPLSGLDMAPFLGTSAHPAAVRSYITAKEQQIGTDLQRFLAAAMSPASAPPTLSNPMRPKSSKREMDGEVGQSKGNDEKDTALIGGASSKMARAVDKRKISVTLNPETRALLLHRHALATGGTGVDAIAAAAAAIAGSGSHHAVLPSELSGEAKTPSPVSSSELTAASEAASATIRLFEEIKRMTPDEARTSALHSATPVPKARVCSSVSLGETKYDCVSMVQHMGSLGGGHYIAHAKNRVTNKWYTFDDSSVYPREAADVQRREAYVLFYARRRGSQVKAPLPAPKDEPIQCYVSKNWWLRYSLLAAPGPITNSDILCDHGALKNQLLETASNVVVGLTRAQYESLAAEYGAAGPPLHSLSRCSDCVYEAKMLSHRRKRERDQIVAVDTTTLAPSDGSVWCLMSEWWLTRWRAFIHSEGASDGTGRGVLPPGPIDNARLLGKDGKPLPNLRSAIHYRGVNVHVWNFLHSIYGGGPALRRREINIYKEEV